MAKVRGYYKQPHAMYDDPEWRSLTLPQRAVWELLRARCNFNRRPFSATIDGRQVEVQAFSCVGSARTVAKDAGCDPKLVRQTMSAVVARGWLDIQQVAPKAWVYHATKAARWQDGATYRATGDVVSSHRRRSRPSPETSSAQPETSSAQPETSSAQPETSSAQPETSSPVTDEFDQDIKGCTRAQERKKRRSEEVKMVADAKRTGAPARQAALQLTPEEPKKGKLKLTQEAVAWLHDLRRDIVATDPKSRLASDETWRRALHHAAWAGEIRSYVAEGHEVAELERLRLWLYSSAGSDFWRRRVHTAADFIRHADSIRGDMQRPRTSSSRGHIGVYRSSEHVHDEAFDINRDELLGDDA